MCRSRRKMQAKYIEQVKELYEDFHVCYMGLQEEEVRGIEKLKTFAKLLTEEREYEL